MQCTCLVQHVFRLLKVALDDHRGVPWVLLENVEGLLDRISEGPPAIEYVVGQLEKMGYSWAYRLVNTAGAALSTLPLPWCAGSYCLLNHSAMQALDYPTGGKESSSLLLCQAIRETCSSLRYSCPCERASMDMQH